MLGHGSGRGWTVKQGAWWVRLSQTNLLVVKGVTGAQAVARVLSASKRERNGVGERGVGVTLFIGGVGGASDAWWGEVLLL